MLQCSAGAEKIGVNWRIDCQINSAADTLIPSVMYIPFEPEIRRPASFLSAVLFLLLVLSACSDDSAIVPQQTTDPDTSVILPASSQATGPEENIAATDVAEIYDATPIPAGAVDAAAITEVVLVTGQSNALGADTSFDAGIDVPHPRAFAFTEDGWRVADLNQVWDLGWHPRNFPDTDPSNNFGFHFARKVAERRPDRVIGFILVTAPGEGISHWDYESEFYVKIRDKVVVALNELPSKATIDGVLWHQGETDWTDSDFYTAKLNDLIRNFRGESWFGDDRPFICGETVAAPVNNRLMALNTDGDIWTGCVASDGAPTFLDGLHFSAEGLRIIGTRYATQYLQMTEQPKE